jgi:hypothetical protein
MSASRSRRNRRHVRCDMEGAMPARTLDASTYHTKISIMAVIHLTS